MWVRVVTSYRHLMKIGDQGGTVSSNRNCRWMLQLGNVWEGASTCMVAVDAEMGRLVFISDIEGLQALSLLFGA